MISGIANSIVVIHRHEWGSLSGIIKRGYLKHTLFTYRWFSQLETSIYRTISSQPRLNTPGGYMLDHKKSYRTTTGWDFPGGFNHFKHPRMWNCHELPNRQSPKSPGGYHPILTVRTRKSVCAVRSNAPWRCLHWTLQWVRRGQTRSTDDGCLWDRDVLYTIIIQTY